MLFAVQFEDDPDLGQSVRQKHMPDHLAFLETNSDRILAAGPLLIGEGAIDGGLWLVEAEDRDAVEALVQADPFWPTGLRRAVRIHHWRQVFADGRRLI